MREQCDPESFRGDFEALAAMVSDSWGQNRDQSLHYGEPFLRSAFSYPKTSFDLAPTIYIDGHPVAFVAGFPRTVRLDGRQQLLASVTFWTTSPSFKRKGYGSKVWMEVLRRARDQGYDGVINFCVAGSPTNEMVLACAERVGSEARRVFSAGHLARILRPTTGAQSVAGLDVVDSFLSAAEHMDESVPLARVWSREEAEWQCLKRAGAQCAVFAEGSRRGVATGYVIEILDEAKTKVLLVEDLLWRDMEAQEQLLLLEQLLNRGAAAGAQIAVTPLMGYAGTNTLKEAGFRQSRRLMHGYLTMWGGVPIPKSLPSLYIDVF